MRLLRAGGLLCLLALMSSPLAAQDFYQGKTITLFVGSAVGGGFDANGRLLARHISRFIPGKPDIVVSNLPGAGSLTAVRHVVNAAQKDGTSIVTFNFGLIGISKVLPAKVPFDFRSLAWIGSISEDLSICYTWAKLGVTTLAELKARQPIHFGLASPGGSEDVNARILKKVLGVDIKQVGGYPGSAQQRLAVERGELDGSCGSWYSLPAEWVGKRLINPVYRTGPAPPEMAPGVPLAHDVAPNADARGIIDLLLAHNALGRPFAASAAVPPDRLAILRAAFDKTVADADFKAEAAKMGQPVSPRNASQAVKVVEEIYSAPDRIVEMARKVLDD